MVARYVQGVDEGFAAAAEVRFGIVYEAWAGGRGRGRYGVVDRVLGHKTALAIEVRREHSDKMIGFRLGRLREIVAGENERWEWLTEVQRLVVLEGGQW